MLAFRLCPAIVIRSLDRYTPAQGFAPRHAIHRHGIPFSSAACAPSAAHARSPLPALEFVCNEVHACRLHCSHQHRLCCHAACCCNSLMEARTGTGKGAHRWCCPRPPAGRRRSSWRRLRPCACAPHAAARTCAGPAILARRDDTDASLGTLRRASVTSSAPPAPHTCHYLPNFHASVTCTPHVPAAHAQQKATASRKEGGLQARKIRDPVHAGCGLLTWTGGGQSGGC